MIDVTVLLITAVVGVIVWLLVDSIFNLRWRNRPPGPPGLPIIGNIHQLSKGPLNVIQKWREVYGDVVAVRFGQYNVVILSGFETIKKALGMYEFSGRPAIKLFLAATNGEKIGFTFNDGKDLFEQRRFALKNLKEFGFGKKSMESMIHEDIAELIEHFKEQEGRPFVPHRKFATATFKSLWNVIAGEKFSYGDPKFQDVMDAINSDASENSLASALFFFPLLIDLFPKYTGMTKFKGAVAKAKTLIESYINEHQKTFQKDSARDYIDVYLKEVSETTDTSSSFYKDRGLRNLTMGTMNLFAAGSDTTGGILVWALLYLIKYPKIQEKLYQEIWSVCGNSRLPSLEDREACVYTWAVMEEVYRISSLAPLSLLHNTMSDVTFQGYFIPKDTIVIPNLYGVHFDEKVWTNPKEFAPERFLMKNGDGKLVKNTKAGPVVAFSIGKRVCPGEVLARNNVFLYLTSLVQKFEITSNQEMDPEATSPGLLREPQKFDIVLKER